MKKFIHIINNFFFCFLRPWTWIQIYATDDTWDDDLNKLLDQNPKVTNIGQYTCRINGLRIWISNYPYAYGRQCEQGPSVLPRTITRVRLRRYINEQIIRDSKESAT